MKGWRFYEEPSAGTVVAVDPSIRRWDEHDTVYDARAASLPGPTRRWPAPV